MVISSEEAILPIADVLNLVVISVTYFLSFLSLFLFFENRRERHYLYFGLYQLLSSIQVTLITPVFYKIVQMPLQELLLDNLQFSFAFNNFFTLLSTFTVYLFFKYLLLLVKWQGRRTLFHLATFIGAAIHLPVSLISFFSGHWMLYLGLLFPLLWIPGIVLFFLAFFKLIRSVSLSNRLLRYTMLGGLFSSLSAVSSLLALKFHSEPLIILGFCLLTLGFLLFAYTLVIKAAADRKALVALKKELEQKVEERTEQLKRSSEERTTLFIKLAHETKTPLTLIKNYLEDYIERGHSDRRLAVVKDNIDKLTRDMTHYLDLENIEKGGACFDHNRVYDISHQMQLKTAFIKEVFWKKGGVLVNSFIEEGLFVRADERAIDKIINNLLENSFKYSPKSGAVIELHLKSEGDQIRLSVKDNGIGMSNEQQKAVFSPYYRAPDIRRNIDGLGMGLHIVKELVHGLGASLALDSRPGEGTTVTLRFKRCSAAERLETESSIAGENPYVGSLTAERLESGEFIAGRPNLLIVEDNYDMSYFLKNSLEQNYNTTFARNGREALELLVNSDSKPELIISDVMMDEMDGFELLDRLQADESLRTIPLLFITARSTEADRVMGFQKGAVAYLDKPFSVDELKASLQSLLKQRSHLSKADLEESFTRRFDRLTLEYGLTPREQEVLTLILQGCEDKEISSRLDISKHTVNSHVRNLFKKCGTSNRLELAALFR